MGRQMVQLLVAGQPCLAAWCSACICIWLHSQRTTALSAASSLAPAIWWRPGPVSPVISKPLCAVRWRESRKGRPQKARLPQGPHQDLATRQVHGMGGRRSKRKDVLDQVRGQGCGMLVCWVSWWHGWAACPQTVAAALLLPGHPGLSQPPQLRFCLFTAVYLAQRSHPLLLLQRPLLALSHHLRSAPASTACSAAAPGRRRARTTTPRLPPCWKSTRPPWSARCRWGAWPAAGLGCMARWASSASLTLLSTAG